MLSAFIKNTWQRANTLVLGGLSASREGPPASGSASEELLGAEHAAQESAGESLVGVGVSWMVGEGLASLGGHG